MKFSRAISRVKWLSSEKNQRFEDRLCPRPQGTSLTTLCSEDRGSKVSQTSTLRTRTEMVFEML
jgi:hypothetical protein